MAKVETEAEFYKRLADMYAETVRKGRDIMLFAVPRDDSKRPENDKAPAG